MMLLTTDKLSPVPIEPVACNLPYGLAWDDLCTILPDFHEQGIDNAQAFLSHHKQGLHGGANSCILTLVYPTGASKQRTTTVFVKQTVSHADMEAGRYSFLASRAIPVPRLLTTVYRDGAEVIVLEFLPTIGIDFCSKVEVDTMLDILADLNTITEVPNDLLPPNNRNPETDAAFDAGVLAAMEESSLDPELGVAIEPARWFEAYRMAQKDYASFPQALTHGQFDYQQMGWAQRGERRQLVLFDLATLSMRPRFADIANILASLAVGAGRPQAALFDRYLHTYHAHASIGLESAAAKRELRLTRIVEGCWSLPWHVYEARQSGAPEWRDAVRWNVTVLQEDLISLEFV